MEVLTQAAILTSLSAPHFVPECGYREDVTTKVDKSALVCLFYFTLNLVKLTPTSLLKFSIFFVTSLSSFTYDENKVAVILKCVVHRDNQNILYYLAL